MVLLYIKIHVDLVTSDQFCPYLIVHISYLNNWRVNLAECYQFAKVWPCQNLCLYGNCVSISLQDVYHLI